MRKRSFLEPLAKLGAVQNSNYPHFALATYLCITKGFHARLSGSSSDYYLLQQVSWPEFRTVWLLKMLASG